MIKEKLNDPAVTDAGESEVILGIPSESGKVTDWIPASGRRVLNPDERRRHDLRNGPGWNLCRKLRTAHVSGRLIVKVESYCRSRNKTRTVDSKGKRRAVDGRARRRQGSNIGNGIIRRVLLPMVHNRAEPFSTTGSFTVHMVPTVGETCTPTVA